MVGGVSNKKYRVTQRLKRIARVFLKGKSHAYSGLKRIQDCGLKGTRDTTLGLSH